MRNIRDFTSSINNRGVLKNNKYIATIALGPDHYLSRRTAGNTNSDVELFSIRCDSVQLPGVSIASADGPPRLGYGPIQKHPYNVNFEDISLTFIVDANSRIHRLLYDWVNCIVNIKGFGGNTLRGNTNNIAGKNWAAYEVGYKQNFSATLEVAVYKDSGVDGNHEKTMTVTAYNAFPMAFPAVGLNWNEGDILRLNVPFSYTDYKIDYPGNN
jgi:hypothetical protein